MPLTARRAVRRMRGGAQAHLLEADNGQFYVVKFQNNPQHRRILVNELLATVFLEHLQIACPSFALIRITQEFLQKNPEVVMELGSKRISPSPGWHFGSRFPGDPERVAVYDFLPDALIPQVANLPDFRGVLVFDKWVGNADGRQSVYFRVRLREWLAGPPEAAQIGDAGQRLCAKAGDHSEDSPPARRSEVHPQRRAFVTVMIDHGFAFNGPHWDFPESPVQGLYPRKVVYSSVRSLQDFEPWLDQVIHFPEEVIDRAYRQIPPEWLGDEPGRLEQLLEKLLRRRKRVPDLINDCRRANVSPFPNWTS